MTPRVCVCHSWAYLCKYTNKNIPSISLPFNISEQGAIQLPCKYLNNNNLIYSLQFSNYLQVHVGKNLIYAICTKVQSNLFAYENSFVSNILCTLYLCTNGQEHYCLVYNHKVMSQLHIVYLIQSTARASSQEYKPFSYNTLHIATVLMHNSIQAKWLACIYLTTSTNLMQKSYQQKGADKQPVDIQIWPFFRVLHMRASNLSTFVCK